MNELEFAKMRADELAPFIKNETATFDQFIEYSIMMRTIELYEDSNNTEEIKTISELIKDSLDRSGLSQKELAEKLRISPSRVSEYLSGKAEPTLKIAGRLCKLLKLVQLKCFRWYDPMRACIQINNQRL